MRNNQQPTAKQTTIGCLAFLGLSALIGGCAALAFSGDDASDDKPLSESAAVMCEEFVKKRLKSPGSAQFPGTWDADYAETTVLSDTKPWKYKVEGHVDSDNDFGASKRNDYVCTVSTEDDDKWTLDDLQLTER